MPRRTWVALTIGLLFGTTALLLMGGCPPSAGNLLGSLTELLGGDAGATDSQNGTGAGSSDETSTTGGSGGGTVGGESIDDTGAGGATDGAGGNDAGGSGSDGFTQAGIIHRGAGGFLVDTTVDLPADANFNVSSSGIKTEVQLARMSSDGSTVWFTAQDGNGFVSPQLFCINTDGTAIREISFPAALLKLPAEIWPAANGQTCAVLIHADGDGFIASESVFLLAGRTSGTMTTLFDARSIQNGENDYVNLQLSGDGSTLFFLGWDSGVIFSLPSSGGMPQIFTTPSAFMRSGSVVDEPVKFRINCDGSAMVVLVEFENPDTSRPRDLYLIDNSGVTQLTNTGDIQTRNDHNWTDMGITTDGRYVVYVRKPSSSDPWQILRMDRIGGGTITLSTVATTSLGYQTLIDCGGSIILAPKGQPNPGGNARQAPGLFSLDGGSALQFQDAWVQNDSRPVEFTTVSSGGGVFIGQWDTNSFGDLDRLHVWYPGSASFRSGPSITRVDFKLDNAAGTLAIRVATSGPVSAVKMYGLSDNFESIYQLADDQDPFFTERWGQKLSATATSGEYEHSVTFDGLTLDNTFRVRVGVSDETGKNFAYVDFRPVPLASETTLDVNGDGIPG